MKVTIKGLTDSTITFNKVGFTLRGNHRKLEQFPNSVASNVEISTKEQIDELNSLVSSKLIEVIEEKPIIIQMPSLQTSKNVEVPFNIDPVETVEQVKVEAPQEKTQKGLEIVTDTPVSQAPVSPTTSSSETVVIKNEEQKTLVSDAKVSDTKVSDTKVSSKSKKIKKLSEKNEKVNKSDDATSVTVIATTTGPVKTGTFKTPDGALDNSPVADESLKAAEDMDIEDKKEDDVVDESKLDPNEKIGNEAVIAMGGNNFKKTAMKKSYIEGQDAMKKHNPFIDAEENELKDKIKTPLIEDSKDDVDPDAFIEI